MKRRTFLAGTAAATLARPAVAQATKTLIFVPQANLTSGSRVHLAMDIAQVSLFDTASEKRL